MVVLENKVKELNDDSIIKKVFSNLKWIANYDASPEGRIWVVWDQTKVEFENNTKFIIGGVYGMHTIQDKKALWEDLRGTMVGISGPSLIMGDFNTILSSEDIVQGNAVQEIEVRDFKGFILDAGLAELRIVGRKFIWTNNHVHNRIDRILVNAEWIQKWPAMEGLIVNPGFSDHCPLSITFDDNNQAGRRPFKFLNGLAQHKDFDDTAKQCWVKGKQGNAMLKVRNKLKMLKGDLK
ncbi:uncharacterized protein LOC142175827 [Nicotiana tabacum]|uniref:Uncharacterized protein LOC142175827 n=1 Tax=Nicotiana tabacum TaxID=4097 RepID=A0AC58TNW6_TOBAC